MRIDVTSGLSLSPFEMADASALVAQLESGDVSRSIPVIPHPYTAEHAEAFLRRRLEFSRQTGLEITFAIRDISRGLIGSVGLDDFAARETDTAEIGYWLGSRYWRRGIMSAVLPAFLEYAFAELPVRRIRARTAAFNIASQRLLKKSGFAYTETQPAGTQTRDGTFDTLHYELTRESWRTWRASAK